LPFLDVEVNRLTNNKLSFKIFLKPTNTQRFIVNESHHSIQQKMAAFNSMLFGGVNVPMSTEDQKAELEYIYEAAKLNGYDKVPRTPQETRQKIFRQTTHHSTIITKEKSKIRISSIFSKSHEKTHTHLQHANIKFT
jgi:hypothetical protein